MRIFFRRPWQHGHTFATATADSLMRLHGVLEGSSSEKSKVAS